MPDTTTNTHQPIQNTDPPVDTKTEPATTSTPKDSGSPSSAPTNYVTKDDVEELLNKARTQERTKLHTELESAQAKAQAAEARAVEKEVELATLKQNAEDAANAKLTSEQKMEKRLAALETERVAEREASRLRDEQYRQQLDAVADAAAQKIHASDMARYRVEKIAALGIEHLPDLVTGNTVEAIDASAKAAKEKEVTIFEAGKAKNQAEQQGQQRADMPRPLSPASVPGSLSLGGLSPQERRTIAKMKPAEYAVHKQKLLAEARQRTGL